MKKFLVEYESLAVLFGDRYSSKIVEAENEKKAIDKVDFDKGGLIKNARATELLYKLCKSNGHEEYFTKLEVAKRHSELCKSEHEASTVWVHNSDEWVKVNF